VISYYNILLKKSSFSAKKGVIGLTFPNFYVTYEYQQKHPSLVLLFENSSLLEFSSLLR